MSIFCWGLSKSGQAGSLGDKTGKVIIPTRVPTKGPYGKVIDLCAGGLYTAAITDKNVLVSFGCGKYGRLGNGNEEGQHTPCYSAVDGSAATMISCGLWHGALLHADGRVSVWGHQKPCGSTDGHVLKPRVVPNLTDCVGISCGNNYTLAWTSDGQAFSWGSALHGVLGHGESGDAVSCPRRIKELEKVKIVSMNAGFAHCGAVTDDGKVYMWGQAKFGALGLGQEAITKKDFTVPQLVPDLEDIKEISCNVGENHGHTLCLSNDGTVYACGDGYKGKLGLSDQEFRYSFTPLPREHFQGDSVKHVSAGGIHSSAVTVGGMVYTWGCGSDGRLGHPEAEGHRYLFRSDVPRAVETLQGMNSINVSASYYHTIALVECQ